MKKHLSTIILILVFLTGLSLLLYPTVSDFWNSFHQSQAIASYAESVSAIGGLHYEKILAEAHAYNEELAENSKGWILSEKDRIEYERQLDIGENGIMGYIEIPKINCSLPIYHGTNEAILQVAVGHIEGTSLPVGGESTHCVLSGHRGLPSANLFTNLDQMEVGDIFMLRVLDEVLTYEVDQILIVEPQETGALQIEEGKDYCTLVTCTPYGVNTHRLLVRGHRIENIEEAKTVRVTADAIQIEPLLVAPAVALPMLIVLLVVLLIKTRKKKK